MTKTYHQHYKDEREQGGRECVHVYCETCRYLGTFYVTPEQPLEGVMRRVETLEEGHVCDKDCDKDDRDKDDCDKDPPVVSL